MPASSLLREARDARTPPGRLAHLAALPPDRPPAGATSFEWAALRPRLLDLIAANPNTDRDTLLLLLLHCPDEVLINPAFELLLLEDPSLLASRDEPLRLAVASSPTAPEAAIRSLLGDPSPAVLTALAAHPLAPPEALRAFTLSPDPPLRTAAARHPALDPAWLDLLIRAGSTPALDAWSGSSGELTAPELALLLTAGEWGRGLVARHPQTPPSWFRLLPPPGPPDAARARGFCCLPARFTASDPRTETPLVRHALASNPRLPPALLESLAEDTSVAVQIAIAQNPSATGQLLARLAGPDLVPGLGVYRGSLVHVARHPATPPACLRQISTCWLPEAARAALDHPRLDPAWKALLDRAGLVPGSQPKGIADLSPPDLSWLAEGATTAQLLVARHPGTPREVLRQLAASPRPEVRARVAANPSIDDDLRKTLARGGDREVLFALAEAPSLAAEVRAVLVEVTLQKKLLPLAFRLIERPEVTVDDCLRLAEIPGAAARVLLRRGAMPGLAEAFAEAGGRLFSALLGSSAAPPPLLAAQARSGEWTTRQMIGMNPVTPPGALALLAHDEDFRVRCAVAANPSCPLASLSLLVQDETPRVQQLARATLGDRFPHEPP
jgi:hypothetical protein